MARFTRKVGGKRHKRAGMSHKKKWVGKNIINPIIVL